MPKWKTNATNFTVTVNYDEKRGSLIRVPKPVLAKLGNPTKLTFVVKNSKIEIVGSK